MGALEITIFKFESVVLLVFVNHQPDGMLEFYCDIERNSI